MEEHAAEHLSEIIPWFKNPPDGLSSETADIITNLWLRDTVLGDAVAGLPWLADGADDQEIIVPRLLQEVAAIDVDLAMKAASLPWLADHVDGGETELLGGLERIASEDLELGRLLAAFHWYTAGVTPDRLIALRHLQRMAAVDLEVARLVAQAPWLADDLTPNELSALGSLSAIAGRGHLELANQLAGSPWFSDGQDRDLHAYALKSLSEISLSNPDNLGLLTTQRWFTDGLNDHEAAFIVTLVGPSSRDQGLYEDLVEEHFMETSTVALPLAGDINIWVIQNTPFPAGEDLLAIIEDTASISEGLLGVPFPTSDIILLVVDSSSKRYRFSGGHSDTHMGLPRSLGTVYHLPHETGHYWFFYPRTGPRWLTEGASEFIARYVDDRTGVRDLADARASNARSFSSCVDRHQMENIRHLTLVLGNQWENRRPIGCPYDMGEYFLHGASAIAGEEQIMSALAELHLSEHGREYDTVEDRIYEVFLNHVPGNRQEEFRAFYQEVHGGAAAFGDTEFSEDHGDKAEYATPIDVGESIGGTLDYMFDFDYFRFRTRDGQKYRISVNHDTLRPTSVGLYSPDGTTGMNKSWIARELMLTGPRIVWIAPISDVYYVAVHNFGGKTGRYTLTIDAVDDPADDHGDTPEEATDISLGEIVQGTVNDDLDIDYFRVPIESDQEYRVVVLSGTLDDFHFRLHLPDGRLWRWRAAQFKSIIPPGFPLRAQGAEEASVGINGRDGSTGTYSIEVVLQNNQPGS